MPRTRNVTRAQSNIAHAPNNSTWTNSGNENGNESEKENAVRQRSRATRSQNRRPLGESDAVVAAVTKGKKSAGTTAVKEKKVSKGKGKLMASPLKKKKLPLQDITSQFLPAPEAANRGEGHEHQVDEEANEVNVVRSIVPFEPRIPYSIPKLASPLPPSSPPSQSSSYVNAAHSLGKTSFSAFLVSPTLERCPEFDTIHSDSCELGDNQSSNFDPFGFVALERKLRIERETDNPLEPNYAEVFEDQGVVLVAGTSSPHPVRRLKYSQFEGESPLVSPAKSRFVTPPTPHKDKQKRRRLSHEGHDIFSPCSSSIESSPSPTKLSVHKKARQEPPMEDALSEFNDEMDRSYEMETVSRKHSEPKIPVVGRNLRSRGSLPEVGEVLDVKLINEAATKRAKKVPYKPHSTASNKQVKSQVVDDDGEDLEEKLARERQERIEYFKRLDGYEVEKEDVYFI